MRDGSRFLGGQNGTVELLSTELEKAVAEQI